MTTIYELDKQATAGPLELTETGETGALFYELMIPDGESVCGFYHMPESRDLDNARLFKHCRNHFMEALKVLKEITDECEQLSVESGRSAEYGGLIDRTRLEIKKLETVE